jgi:hypothetical protein
VTGQRLRTAKKEKEKKKPQRKISFPKLTSAFSKQNRMKQPAGLPGLVSYPITRLHAAIASQSSRASSSVRPICFTKKKKRKRREFILNICGEFPQLECCMFVLQNRRASTIWCWAMCTGLSTPL